MPELRPYNPGPANREYLDYCWQLIESVPYRVSLRWLFYRLLDSGKFPKRVGSKDSYELTPFKFPLGEARRRFYKSWRPWTLTDEMRQPILSEGWRDSPREWIQNAVDEGIFQLNSYHNQPNPIILVYEARAMSEQFRYYAGNFDLFPIGGDSSIDFNWRIAKHSYDLGGAAIAYFGDLDKKGGRIYQAFKETVGGFLSRLDIEPRIVRGGLTYDQAERFSLQVKPGTKAKYQWESLSDEQAAELINEATAGFWSEDVYQSTREMSTMADNLIRSALEKIVDKLPN